MIKTLGTHAAGASFAAAQNALLIGLGPQENEQTRPTVPVPHSDELLQAGFSVQSRDSAAAAGAYSSKPSGPFGGGHQVLRQSPPIAHVLVCDDETRLGDLTAGLLEECGFAAGFVPTAVEAMAYLDAHPDTRVLLLDVNLSGGKSAFDLLNFVVAKARPLRVVLTSGSSKQEVRGDLTQHHLVVGYLEKPYAEEDLTAAITDALRV